MEHTLHPGTLLWQRPTVRADDVVRLPARATAAHELPAGACIAVQSGRIWLTQAGDANDYFVDAGERHVVTRTGRVVIEGFSPLTLLRVSTSAPAARLGCP
jgi:hypothetical protein